MISNYKHWQKLFLFCLGLFAGTAFCMKWMEGDFLLNGEKFTIIGLEITYPEEKVASILAGLDVHVKKILRYHLSFDFAFMLGVYPGIAALCMMAREKLVNSGLRKLLLVLAVLQMLAWGCDIVENYCLLHWIANPVYRLSAVWQNVGYNQPGTGFVIYHVIVAAKWVIALTGALLAIPLALKRRKII